jgi:hypothetical protein
MYVAIISKHSFARGVYPVPQLVPLSGEHQLEQLGDRLGILLDLFLRVGVKDGETGVDVPFVCVDAKRYVLFNVLDATDIAGCLPWKLIIRRPSSAHAKEGGVCDSLCVCCYAVVLLACEVDVLRSETGHDVLDKGEIGV